MDQPTDQGAPWPTGPVWEWIYHACSVVVAIELGLVILILAFVAWVEWQSLREDAAEYRAIKKTSQELEALFAEGRQAVINRLNRR